MSSILNDIKTLLGILPEYPYFDSAIIIHINTVMSVLEQLGCPKFSISGTTETWNSYLGSDDRLELIKTYIYIKVRKVFDPPASSNVLNALEETAKELEWRINSKVDYETEEPNV